MIGAAVRRRKRWGRPSAVAHGRVARRRRRPSRTSPTARSEGSGRVSVVDVQAQPDGSSSPGRRLAGAVVGVRRFGVDVDGVTRAVRGSGEFVVLDADSGAERERVSLPGCVGVYGIDVVGERAMVHAGVLVREAWRE